MDYVLNPEVLEVKEGYIELLTKPGLGIEINEDILKEGQKIGHNWANPIWRNTDGNFAEW